MNPVQDAPLRALAVMAHPDDVDFGAGGTIATWTDAGCEVAYCIVTDGAAGGSDRSVPRDEMARLRESEQRAAAELVGVSDVRFLRYSDGSLVPSIDLRRDISRIIRQVRPERVICQSPERWWDRFQASHPDHLAAGEACLSAVYPDSRNPFAHPELLEKEGLEPWAVPEVWMMASPRMDTYVDVTKNVDRKIDALRCHATQVSDPLAMEQMVRGWLSGFASSQGLPEGTYVEGFQLLKTA
ncbi:MAG TPA: PIG-L deacetylase family protein [Acidimicrobiales bacterium]|nr:PIG-L deacetylase family protein [Acidimicrobiales bacterium]